MEPKARALGIDVLVYTAVAQSCFDVTCGAIGQGGTMALANMLPKGFPGVPVIAVVAKV